MLLPDLYSGLGFTIDDPVLADPLLDTFDIGVFDRIVAWKNNNLHFISLSCAILLIVCKISYLSKDKIKISFRN